MNTISLAPETSNIGTRPCPDCYVCGLPGQLLYSGLPDRYFGAPGRWDLRKCPDPDCGLIWLDPMPIEEDIGRAYKQYYTHDVDEEAHPSQKKSFNLRLYLIKRSPLRPLVSFLKRGHLASKFGYALDTSLLQRLVSYSIYLFPREVHLLAQQLRFTHFVPGGKLLDVGCGDGGYLAQMRDLGWEVEGVEVDPLAVKQARKLNLPVYLGALEQKRFENNLFDAVIINHVIEHVHDPLKVLKECYRILKPGGKLVVITPNARSIAHCWFGEYWWQLDPPRHLHLFTSDALKKNAEAASFHVQLRTSAIGACRSYVESEILARNHHSSNIGCRFRLFLKARFFDLYEFYSILRDKDCGEEIILKGIKQ